MELLVWFSGPGYKAQELRDQAPHTGFPCRSPARLVVTSDALLSVMRDTHFHSACSPHHGQGLGRYRDQLPPDHSAREPRCSMAASACGLAWKVPRGPQSARCKKRDQRMSQ